MAVLSAWFHLSVGRQAVWGGYGGPGNQKGYRRKDGCAGTVEEGGNCSGKPGGDIVLLSAPAGTGRTGTRRSRIET